MIEKPYRLGCGGAMRRSTRWDEFGGARTADVGAWRLLNVWRMATIGTMAAGVAHELNQPPQPHANYAQACGRLLTVPQATSRI
jgi:hypothetical protein